MRRMKVKLAVVVALLFCTGCASIVGKNLFAVTLNSKPDRANVLIEDERGKKMFTGTTPTTVTLVSGESYFHAKTYKVTFSKEGYREQYAEIKSTISGWYWGNILFGGLIGILIVDPITGNMWKLPKDLSVDLAPQTVLNDGRPVLQIVTIDQVPERMRQYLVRLK